MDRARRRFVRGAAGATLLAGCASLRQPADAPDLVRHSAKKLALALRERRTSSVELCRQSIARIERLDGPINAVVVRDFERALADAAAADRALARNDSRPLLGLPATVKESFDLEGFPTTFGLEEHRTHRAAHDAVAVARLRAAGAVILGKTNVPTNLADFQSDNPVYGRTNNPYNFAMTPGGSSGGAAAALAMGFCALALGSDLGGSLRVPAAFCGVCTLKPSYGAVPVRGHAPGGADRLAPSMLVAGPMARAPEDLALMLGAIAGPDEIAATSLQFPPARHSVLSNYRVFVFDDLPDTAVDRQTRAALERTVAQLVEQGVSVTRRPGALPQFESIRQIGRRLARARGPDQDTTTARELFAALEDQRRLKRTFARLFEEYDVILAPAFGTTAFPHTTQPDIEKRRLLIDGVEAPYNPQGRWSGMASVAELPAAVVPIGVDGQGLPIGAQVIADFLADLTALDFAGRIVRPVPPPSFAL